MLRSYHDNESDIQKVFKEDPDLEISVKNLVHRITGLNEYDDKFWNRYNSICFLTQNYLLCKTHISTDYFTKPIKCTIHLRGVQLNVLYSLKCSPLKFAVGTESSITQM